MSQNVNPPRRYDSSKRQNAARETRAAIIEAARALFLAQGYQVTTMSEIAERAGVHVDTIYAVVGRKPEMLRLLLEAAISGTDAAVPAQARAYVQEMEAEPDPRRRLVRYAGAVREIMDRLAPLLLVVRAAAASDASLAAVWSEISERRAANMRTLIASLMTVTPLRDGLTLEQAADVVWATNSPEFYTLLVTERGWTPDMLETFLAETWVRLLLPDERL